MNLGQDYEARFGQDFKFKFSRDADGCLVEILKFMLIEIPKLKFDQDLCASCDMNSNLGSVVPLAMFYTDDPILSCSANKKLLGFEIFMRQ